MEISSVIFFLPKFCNCSAEVEVVVTRAGIVHVRKMEEGEDVSEEFTRMDYANYDEERGKEDVR